MNKHITLIAICLLSYGILKAQNGSSYFLYNSSIPTMQSALGFNGLSSGNMRSTRGTNHVGLQWIKGMKDDKALRFGISLYAKALNDFSYQYRIGDTSFYNHTSSFIASPLLHAGKEFRKYIHKDIHIYGGADAELSPAFLNSISTRYYTLNDNIFRQSMNSVGKNKIGLTAGIRPFIGIRTEWGRFAIGYEVSAPIRYTFSSMKPNSSLPLDFLSLSHNLCLGIRLNKAKKKFVPKLD